MSGVKVQTVEIFEKYKEVKQEHRFAEDAKNEAAFESTIKDRSVQKAEELARTRLDKLIHHERTYKRANEESIQALRNKHEKEKSEIMQFMKADRNKLLSARNKAERTASRKGLDELSNQWRIAYKRLELHAESLKSEVTEYEVLSITREQSMAEDLCSKKCEYFYAEARQQRAINRQLHDERNEARAQWTFQEARLKKENERKRG